MTFALSTMTRKFGGMEGGITSCFLGQMFGRPREEGKRKMGHGKSPRQKHANAFMWMPPPAD